MDDRFWVNLNFAWSCCSGAIQHGRALQKAPQNSIQGQAPLFSAPGHLHFSCYSEVKIEMWHQQHMLWSVSWQRQMLFIRTILISSSTSLTNYPHFLNKSRLIDRITVCYANNVFYDIPLPLLLSIGSVSSATAGPGGRSGLSERHQDWWCQIGWQAAGAEQLRRGLQVGTVTAHLASEPAVHEKERNTGFGTCGWRRRCLAQWCCWWNRGSYDIIDGPSLGGNYAIYERSCDDTERSQQPRAKGVGPGLGCAWIWVCKLYLQVVTRSPHFEIWLWFLLQSKQCRFSFFFWTHCCRLQASCYSHPEKQKSSIDVCYHQIWNDIQGCSTKAPPLSRGGRVRTGDRSMASPMPCQAIVTLWEPLARCISIIFESLCHIWSSYIKQF